MAIPTPPNYSASDTLTNSFGCDSIVMLHFDKDSVSDLSVSAYNFWVSTTNVTADTYQWLDCNNNYSIINGETDTAYYFTQNGSYAVEITEGQCSDTSSCVIVTTVGLVNLTKEDAFVIMPNPFKNFFMLSFTQFVEQLEVEIRNTQGKIIWQKKLKQASNLKIELDAPAGVYFLNVKSPGGQSVVKLIKE